MTGVARKKTPAPEGPSLFEAPTAPAFVRQPVTKPQVEAFRAGAEAKLHDYYRDNYPRLTERKLFPTMVMEEVGDYWRLARRDHTVQTAWAFVHKATGDIHPPWTWNRPLKAVCGNINTPTHGVEFVSALGPEPER